MRSDEESDPYSIIPKLPLFSMNTPHLHEPSGILTPPLQTTASVPFRWEEKPGKPRPCTDIILSSTRPDKTLDLPPRLAIFESNVITKTPSPTIVLDGPGCLRGKSVFLSSSFRLSTERRRVGQMQGSFDSGASSPDDDDDGGGQDVFLLANKEHWNGGRRRRFGCFRLRDTCKPNDDKGSFVISPSSMVKRMRRNSSMSKVTRSHFWTTIYERFKQVIPWKKESFHV